MNKLIERYKEDLIDTDFDEYLHMLKRGDLRKLVKALEAAD